MFEQLIQCIGNGLPVCMCPPPPLDEDSYHKLCWELGKALIGWVESLEARVEAARCTKSLSSYIEQYGYRGDRDA